MHESMVGNLKDIAIGDYAEVALGSENRRDSVQLAHHRSTRRSRVHIESHRRVRRL